MRAEGGRRVRSESGGRRGAGRAAALLLALALAGALSSWPAPAAAHRLAPSLLQLVEREDGGVDVVWRTSLLVPSGTAPAPVLPEDCVSRGEPEASRSDTAATLRFSVACPDGLVGRTLSVRGLAESGTNALVRVELADGRRLRAVLHAGAPAYLVPARESAARVAAGYLRLGVHHIAGGLDHVLFVLGLVLLVRGARRLLATVTAFTAGHSVTLCLAALGLVRVPAAPVEVAIAASVFWLALELCGAAPGRLAARRPWALAGGFGLLHGLGFAGALTAVGLPPGDVSLALAAFNAGVELGQLALVAAIVAARRVLPDAGDAGRALRPLRLAPAYAMGTLAAYWILARVGVGVGDVLNF